MSNINTTTATATATSTGSGSGSNSNLSEDNYYMEIPVVYPTILQPLVSTNNNSNDTAIDTDFYIVNDVNGTIQQQYRHSLNNTGDTTTPGQQQQQYDIRYDTISSAYGMSSISEMTMMVDTTRSASSSNNNNNHHHNHPPTTRTEVVVIATSPITDRIIAISRLYKSTTSTLLPPPPPPKVIHVDFGTECSILTQPIVAVQAFSIPTTSSPSLSLPSSSRRNNTDDNENSNDPTAFELVVIDASANIITVRFTIHTVTPICLPSSFVSSSPPLVSHPTAAAAAGTTTANGPLYVQCLSVSSKINNHFWSRNYSNNDNHHITKNMITFCTATTTSDDDDTDNENHNNSGTNTNCRVIVIAYNPYLLAVDRITGQMEFWSPNQCLQSMIRQQQQQHIQLSAISSLFYKGAGYILGTTTTTTNGGGGNRSAVTTSGPSDGVLSTTTTSYHGDVDDMMPVAAICSCSDAQTTQQHVFTLHADGMVRHWTMDIVSSSTMPDQKLSLLPNTIQTITSQHIPNPSLWNSDASLYNNSISMHARLYDTNLHYESNNELLIPITTPSTMTGGTGAMSFVLIVQIQTSIPIPYDAAMISVLDDSQRAIPTESPLNIIAIDGMAHRPVSELLSEMDDSTVGTNHHSSSIRLTAPDNSTDLIDMQLDCCCGSTVVDGTNENPVLRTMFYSYRTGQSMICSYPKTSTISILSKDPIIHNVDPTRTLYMDSIIENELERINQLSFYEPYIKNQFGSSNSNMAAVYDTGIDIVEEIDQRYMQYLFRPNSPRGNGTVLPPRSHHIYTAMRIVLPSDTNILHRHSNYPHSSGYSNTTTTTSNISPIEVDVYDFIQEWRGRDRRYNNVSNRTNNDNGGILVQYQPQLEHTVGVQDAATNNGEVYDTTGNIEQHFQQEEERWRTFLLQIWQQEQKDHIPTSMKFFTTTTGGTNDATDEKRTGGNDIAMIVRPGFISTETFNGKRNGNGESAMDRLCCELLCDEEYETMSRVIEMTANETITNNILNIGNLIGNTFCQQEKISTSIMGKIIELSKTDRESISAANDNLPWYASKLSALGSVPLNALSIHMRNQSSSRTVTDIHTRLAATALLVRSLNAIRQLTIARYFVLLEVQGSSHVDRSLLQMYLHTTAVMYVASQMVPTTALRKYIDPTLQQLPLNNRSLRRQSQVTSILDVRGMRNETISSDPLLVYLSSNIPVDSEKASSFCTTSVMLTQLGIVACLAGNISSALPTGSHLPELGMLVMTTDEIEYPALALRLLSVCDAFPRPDDDQATNRKVLIAKCLINVSRYNMSTVEAFEMIHRALEMFPFDPTNPGISVDNLRMLENQIGDNHTVGIALFIQYIREAITTTSCDNPDTNEVLDMLHSALFNCSVAREQWDAAYDAISTRPSSKYRREKFQRLVRAMVNAGALAELLDLIENNRNNATNLYETAVDALSDMTIHDIYSSMVLHPSTPTDYIGASFALHASQRQWKQAAQAMDLRYTYARAALGTPVGGLNVVQCLKREELIVNDMTLAALGCFNSMAKVSDHNSKYLLSRGNDNYGRISNVYMSMDDIELRSKRCHVLKMLFDDKLGNPSFSIRAFGSDGLVSEVPDYVIVEQLFLQGFYSAGIALAECMDKVAGGKPNGRSVLFDVVSQLVLDFLLPLALDKFQTPERPTISQLQATIADMTGPDHNSKTLLLGHRSANYSDLEQSTLRTGAMLLTEILTIKYTSDETPLANEVAAEMLSPHRVRTPVPVWLEELLLTGTNQTDLPGLFSRRRKPGVEGYLGNPTVLLDIYIKNGLVKDACRVVTRVFNEFTNNRGHLAASRLPEKGEMDFIPYKKINLLWNLVDVRLKKVRQQTASEMEAARIEMKESIDKYSELAKIAEMGQTSARCL